MAKYLKDVSNAVMLDRIRNDLSMEYQSRVPKATQAGVAATMRAIMDYRPNKNEFIDALVNRIGSEIARRISWSNPLAEFKRGRLEYGDTIQEMQAGLLKAHAYNSDRDYMERTLFGTELPDVQTNYHTVNREEFYKITVNETLLRRAFEQNGGLATFVETLMDVPTTSNSYDEFLLTMALIPEYESNGGFYHVNVPDVRSWDSGESDAKMALRKIRAMSGNLEFLSSRYNAAGMPTFAKAEDQFLLATPEFTAALDVEALASAFNIDRANVYQRIINVPAANFGISGAQALLTSRDFFVIADTVLENTSQYNAANLHTNYFLHNHQIISASRFVPSVLFWTGADDEVITVNPPVDEISELTVTDIYGDAIDIETTPLNRGFIYQVNGEAITDPTGGTNVAVRWNVTGNQLLGTFITDNGVLHISPRETAATITVTATSTWINPDNVREDFKTKSITITIGGESAPEWPRVGEVGAITVKGVPVANFDVDTLTYESPVAGLITAADVAIYATAGGGTTVITDDGAGNVTITFDGGQNATKVYTVESQEIEEPEEPEEPEI